VLSSAGTINVGQIGNTVFNATSGSITLNRVTNFAGTISVIGDPCFLVTLGVITSSGTPLLTSSRVPVTSATGSDLRGTWTSSAGLPLFTLNGTVSSPLNIYAGAGANWVRGNLTVLTGQSVSISSGSSLVPGTDWRTVGTGQINVGFNGVLSVGVSLTGNVALTTTGGVGGASVFIPPSCTGTFNSPVMSGTIACSGSCTFAAGASVYSAGRVISQFGGSVSFAPGSSLSNGAVVVADSIVNINCDVGAGTTISGIGTVSFVISIVTGPVTLTASKFGTRQLLCHRPLWI
jgi:hypothetical protein